MKRDFTFKLGIYLSGALLALGISTQAFASDFNLPFINASDLGNAYAGWAASATDASTTYSNPAGLVRLTDPQLVIAALGVTGTTHYHGTTGTPFSTQSGEASGTLGGFLPLIYYAHPLSNRVVFGLGLNGPFGLGTNYAKDTMVRYLATRSQVVVIDLSPSIGVKINDKLSFGVGIDIERLSLKLNNMLGPPISTPDGEDQNNLHGWGVGFHGGLLYQFNPCTRIGWSYNSQVMFHTVGSSEFFGVSGNNRTRQRLNTALPSYTQISAYQDIRERWTAMASIFYTHWRTINQLTLQSVALPHGFTLLESIPFEYHNTLDYSAGVSYKPNDKWILRTGITFFNAPSNNRDRSVADPIGKMILAAIGAHYQYNAKFGYDVGYAHDFFRQTAINLATPIIRASGHSNTGSNIFGGQMTWNM